MNDMEADSVQATAVDPSFMVQHIRYDVSVGMVHNRCGWPMGWGYTSIHSIISTRYLRTYICHLQDNLIAWIMWIERRVKVNGNNVGTLMWSK